MKSTETKLTAYGRWWRRTSVANDVILTSVVVVSARPYLGGPLGWQSSSFCDDDRHNAICRGYAAGTMAARAIIGDELYRSLQWALDWSCPIVDHELRLNLFTTTRSSSSSRLLSSASSPPPSSSSLIDSDTSEATRHSSALKRAEERRTAQATASANEQTGPCKKQSRDSIHDHHYRIALACMSSKCALYCAWRAHQSFNNTQQRIIFIYVCNKILKLESS